MLQGLLNLVEKTMSSYIFSHLNVGDLTKVSFVCFNLQGRWYYRREAVKDLHSTLIRLLNELSPWEPKLAKAFQRNRYNSFDI